MTPKSVFDTWGPSFWLTKAAGWLAKVKIPFIKNLLIQQFIKFYRVDMTPAIRQDPSQFENFQDFFTRELKSAARPIHGDSHSIVSPVDGTVAVCGRYTNNTLIQYKRTSTNLFNLTRSKRIGEAGQYAIIYLSPKDYHRVHSPVQAELVAVSRIGGSRHSVKPSNHNQMDGLYERNTRVNCHLRTPRGEMLMSMVGAMIVSSVQTQWDDESPPKQVMVAKDITPRPFLPGEEMARFCLGSTVILVVPDGIGELQSLDPGQSLKLGEQIGAIEP
ncbi:MAG: archaetidylserine decarboxylase [Gammaproteobacteria bacterium]|nr:archaetidylserine decarboxylase [Gammaproteobacteria bacterium]